MSTIEETGYDDDIFINSKYDTETMRYLRESLFETKNKYDESYLPHLKMHLILIFCHTIIILRMLIVEQYESVSYILSNFTIEDLRCNDIYKLIVFENDYYP